MSNKLLRSFFKLFAPNYLWKKECPITPDAVVMDFINNQISIEGKQMLASLTEQELEGSKTLGFRRRIAAIYGIAEFYDSPNGSPSKPGWNKELLNNYWASPPEKAIGEILHRIWKKIQKNEQLKMK